MDRRGTFADEAGQTVVVFVFLLAGLIAFSALVIDGGQYLLTKRHLQGDVDAAAMAGVRELPGSQTLASAAARDYAETRNNTGGTVSNITYTGTTRMKVDIERTTPGAFMTFFGMSAPVIKATATAEVAQVNELEGMLPFAALDGVVVTGGAPTSLPIKVSQPPEFGNFGAVAPYYDPPDCLGDPGGANGHMEEIMGSFDPEGVVTCGPPVGTDLNTQTGNMVGKTKDGLCRRFGNDDGNNCDSTHADLFADTVHLDPTTGKYVVDKPNSPRIGYIPVINAWPTGSSNDVTVVDYVLVYIGKLGEPGEPAYTDAAGATINVWVTPLDSIMPPNNVVGTSTTWDPNSTAPVIYRLVA